MAHRTCPQCGAEIPPHVRFCGNCGFDAGAAPVSGGNTTLRILSVVALLIIGCPPGVLGGLQLILAISGGAPVNQLGFGFAMLFINLVFLGFVVWAFRKR